MIHFKVKKKKVPDNTIKHMGIGVTNAAVEKMADILNKKYSGTACRHHPDHHCTITFVVTDKSYKTVKSNFCCKEFENSIVIDSHT